MNVMTAGLKHITSGNADKALADLQKFIINIFSFLQILFNFEESCDTLHVSDLFFAGG